MRSSHHPETYRLRTLDIADTLAVIKRHQKITSIRICNNTTS